MGLRLSMIVGASLFLLPAGFPGPAAAWAQAPAPAGDKGGDPAPPPAVPAPPNEAAEPQGGLVPLPGIDAEDPPAKASAPARKKAQRPEPDPADVPADRPAVRPPADDQVRPAAAAEPADGPTPPAPAAPAPAGPEGAGAFVVLPPEKLVPGPQEVAVTVDVQAPPTMNYKQPASVRLVVKNTGSAEAHGVVVRDRLPSGLKFLSSSIEPSQKIDDLLSWDLGTLPGGAERAISLKVEPTLETGAVEHSATVTFKTGSKAISRVLRPRLKIEVTRYPSTPDILKGDSTEFRISVRNVGNGPARNVLIKAKLSEGLRHETGERNEENVFELPLEQLAEGQREELDPLTVDAKMGGEQTCKVTVASPDVIDNEESEIIQTIRVVEPQLKVVLHAPETRITESVADYEIQVQNPGTAPATNVQVVATLPVNGRLITVDKDAAFDPSTRRLRWNLGTIPPSDKERRLAFHVRMGGVDRYEVIVDAKGDRMLSASDRRFTDVKGMPDVDLVVTEKNRVVDVGGETTFKITLRNYGTKEARNLKVRAELSDNLAVTETAGGPEEEAQVNEPKNDKVQFPVIPLLDKNKQMVLGIKAKVTGLGEKFGTCRVYIEHDDLPKALDDAAMVKVQEGRRPPPSQP